MYFYSIFIQVDMSILNIVSISCVSMCGIEAHLWPIVKDMCNKKVVAVLSTLLCSHWFWTGPATACLWVARTEPGEAVGWSQGPDHD